MKKLLLGTFLAVIFTLFACKKNDNLIVQELPNSISDELAAAFLVQLQTADFQKQLPNYLVTMGLSQPTIDIHKATLGRVVFYDKNLSKDGTISCASCHKQSSAFADNVAFSQGIEGQMTSRNSMSLSNVASFASHYTTIDGRRPALLWDGRATEVVNQAPLAFENPHEMGLSMQEVLQKARDQEYYPYFMTKAFGDREVTESRLLEGLQEFVRSMGSAESKLDKALERVNGDLLGTTTELKVITVARYYYGPIDTIGTDTIILPLLNFAETELRGRNLFAQNCTKCHTPIRTLQQEFMACNGLEMNYLDKGLGGVTERTEDNGVFKSSSLRNISLTAPYMHDGRFKTLEEVMDFYSTGIQGHANLHPLLRDDNGQALKMNFSPQDKKDLIAFLKTMTSYDVLSDTRFANPFN
jgi:cytochrome c peroxidase